jgi:coniferyl-aldehyde dehydrogenase
VIVDSDGAFDSIAPKIAIGKLFNAGQTCIAPDYALVPRARTDEFVKSDDGRDGEALSDAGRQRRLHEHRQRSATTPASPASSPMRNRVGARVIEVNPAGEKLDPATRKLAPALVLDVGADMAVMREEIFGPLLPVVPYDRLEDALDYVNAHDRPLALYWFGDDASRRDRVLGNTIAGGVTVNGCLTHFAQEAQPFGGVGASGMGSYHGVYGFRTFSKETAVYYQGRFGIMPLLLPPYGRVLDRVLAWFTKT